MEQGEPSARQAEIDRQARGLSPPASARTANLLTLLVLGGPVAVAMTGFLGGGPPARTADSNPAAMLEVTAPERVRSGNIGEIGIRLRPAATAARPAIIIPEDWLRGVTINQTSPQPLSESHAPGATRLEFAPIKGGEELHLTLSFQINPDRAGRSGGRVIAVDGSRPLASLPVQLMVLP